MSLGNTRLYLNTYINQNQSAILELHLLKIATLQQLTANNKTDQMGPENDRLKTQSNNN